VADPTASSIGLTPAAPLHGGADTRLATWLSVGVAAVLLVLKVVVWTWSGSVALLASAADSGLDVAASAATFFAVRYAAAPPDAEHRFGHGKAEAFSSLLQAGLVFASAALIGQEAVRHIFRPAPVSREGWAIGVMLLSMVLTGGLVAVQTIVLRRGRSVAVSGDRMHYVTDLASNFVALAGIGAVALFGSTVLDAVAGLIIAAILLWGAIVVFRQASNELMDRELPDSDRARIATLAMADPRLRAVHQLRTRASGPTVHIQMHADLEPDVSLIVAHQVVVAAERRILDAFPGADIIIHADPRGRAEPHGGESFLEDDAEAAPI
jgi:ferrous-iron efflux pump FieF